MFDQLTEIASLFWRQRSSLSNGHETNFNDFTIFHNNLSLVFATSILAMNVDGFMIVRIE